MEKLHRELKRLNIRFNLIATTEPCDATRIARQMVAQGARRIIAVGGDGTISEVVNAISGTSVELGIISVGTGNDVARSLGLPVNDPVRSLQVILSGEPRAIDVGVEEDRCFISLLGLGFPTLVAVETNRMRWLKGSPAFFVAVYKALYHMKAVPLRLELDDRTLDLDCTSVLIQNTPYTGGGLYMAPEARMDDGFLDVVVVNKIGKLDLMWNFPKVYKGRHFEHPKFNVYRSRTVHIDSPLKLPKMFDGDICGTTPVRARVIQGALTVLVPGGARP